MLGPILVSLHNLHFFAEFLAAIREAITDNTLAQKATAWVEAMYSEDGNP